VAHLVKYLVFVSSTCDDVKTERLTLIKTITELGAIPLTMDAFDITDEHDRAIIRKAIEDSDYFINLTAHKGGASFDMPGGTFRSLEYEYLCAVKARVPILPLIIDEKARWKASKKAQDEETQAALETFKGKLRSHHYSTWLNGDDLHNKALELLSAEMNLNPRSGWIPANQAVNPDVANEVCRLLAENENLRRRIHLAEPESIAHVKDEIVRALDALSVTRIPLSFYYVDGEQWENTRKFRYLRLFRLLVPELSIQKSVAEISQFLGNVLNPSIEKNVRKDYATPHNTIKKIMADFTLLKLVRYCGTSAAEAWEITEFGKEAFAVYRLRQMEKSLAKLIEPEDPEDEASAT